MVIQFKNRIILLMLFIATQVSMCKNSTSTTDVVINSNGCELSGVIERPKDGKNKYPAIIFGHGSGPTDKDGSLTINNRIYKPFRTLSNEIVRDGYICLRFDNRPYLNNKKEKYTENVTLNVLLDDYVAAYKFMQKNKYVQEDKIIFIGYSLSATVFHLLNERCKFYKAVLIAPAFQRFDSLIDWQIENQIKAVEKTTNDSMVMKQLIEMKQSFQKKFDGIIKGSVDTNKIMFGASELFWSQIINGTSDQVKSMEKMRIPILVVHGTADDMLPVMDIRNKKKKILKNEMICSKEIAGMNHLLFNKGNKIQVNEELIMSLKDWLRKE